MLCSVLKSRKQERFPSKKFGKERSFERWPYHEEYEAHRLDAVQVVKFCPDNELFVLRTPFKAARSGVINYVLVTPFLI